MLGELLGQTIIQQAGQEVYDLEEEIRGLSKSWRQGDESANASLANIMSELASDLPVAADIVKAFSTYFQLVNLAEEHQRVRILRDRENNAFVSNIPMDETIEDAISKLKHQGVSAEELQATLNRVYITPVFTAHPTESRRRTVRQILKHVSAVVDGIQSAGTMEFEKPELNRKLKSLVTLLWQSDATRDRRPTVMDEVRNTGLYFFEETLFDVVPQIYEEIESALQEHYPDHEFQLSPFLTYGSWIGGDRDGNPLVTDDVTWKTLQAQKEQALERYQKDVFELYELLSVSQNRVGFSQQFQADMKEIRSAVSDQDVIHRFRLEPYRQKFILVFRKLRATRNVNVDNVQAENTGIYSSATELLDDLNLVRESLEANCGADLVKGELARLIRRVEIFGFHLATLDVRQHAKRHRSAIQEICERYEIADDYTAMNEQEKVELLTGLIRSKRPLTAKLEFSEETNSILSLFEVIANAQKNIDPNAMQTYIISMTESVSNLLEILLLMKNANLFGKLDLVPLFETVDDLNQAPETMLTLFNNPVYKEHLAARGNRQQIMIGYSDSNKDGGYFRANWMLFSAQRRMAAACREQGVALTLFHGRGGSLGRGGGPANRAILSQPPESVDGRIRITEQGEVVSSRYSNPAIARRHLQQLVHAVLCSTGERTTYDQLERWSTVMDEISELAFQKYKSLVEDAKFIDYFESATPIELVENLNIGSRPTRRKSSRGIEDLRAIPWVFSWTQSRANISSWFGIGTAVRDWCAGAPDRLSQLQEMYRDWPFFNSILKNVHLGLGRADMDIAGLYAKLAGEDCRPIFDQIFSEFQLTSEHLLQVTGHENILDTEPWLQRSIRVRNPYVDPLNYIQVALLERLRSSEELDEDAQDELTRVLSNSVNGIAAGLQNVG